jgi:TolB-like protein
MNFIAELKRRRVIRVALGYLALAWLLVEVSATTFPMLRLPDWAPTLVLVLLLIGFPVALVFAWVYQVTPEGVERDTGTERVADAHAGPAPVPPSTVTALPSERSIAVLPFVNMSDDPANEYFSDGLSEELLNLLAQIPELHVAARTSSFSFKGEKIDIPSVATKLNVANVLEGSVRKAGNRVRITTQLIRAANGYHLWSETYDRTLEDIFAVQDDIAGSVVGALKVSLLGDVPKARETDPEAYSYYLQGVHFRRSGEGDNFQKARLAFERALALDPAHAPAWAELADTFQSLVSFGLIKRDDGVERAFDAIDQALALDDGLAEAHIVNARLHMVFKHDWSTAETALNHARQLAPGIAGVALLAGNLDKTLGHFEEAVGKLRRAISLDPLNTTAHIWLSLVLIAQRRLDEACGVLNQILELNPNRSVAHMILGRILLLQGRPGAAHEEMLKEPEGYWRHYGVAFSLYAMGKRQEADAALRYLVEQYGEEGPFQVAEVYAFRGEIDEAFQWLERAREVGDPGLTELLTSQTLPAMYEDSRWPVFVRKAGMCWPLREAQPASSAS